MLIRLAVLPDDLPKKAGAARESPGSGVCWQPSRGRLTLAQISHIRPLVYYNLHQLSHSEREYLHYLLFPGTTKSNYD